MIPKEENSCKQNFRTTADEILNVFKMGGAYEKGDSQEVVLSGLKARGAGYRIRKRLAKDYKIVPIKDASQEIEPYNRKRILFLDLRDFNGEVPERIRDFVSKRKKTKLFIVDVKGDIRQDHQFVENFTYQVEVDSYIRGMGIDIDPSISRAIAELYINVDDAVDKDGIKVGRKRIKPYFRTSALIDYPRSRDILEGNLCSVIRKFAPDVIVSRDVIGKPPEDDVRMDELANPIAHKLGLKSAIITRKGPRSFALRGNVKGKRVLILEDVVGKGTTKLQLIDLIRKEKGDVRSCIVCVDRKEGAAEILDEKETALYSLMDIDMYNTVAAERNP
ncbi:MAG: phosphoribosyltransferase family protein [Candidatus Woesearchaeota archaeon]